MALQTKSSTDVAKHIDPAQTLRAAQALVRKIQSDRVTRRATAEKASLLADADDSEADNETPIWLILTTKKHISDRPRLKPGKILLPHPFLDTSDPNLRICLITADPQRKYKDIITDPSFPLDFAKRVGRVIGITKLKAKYKSFDSRRQLLSQYDVFFADDRIITQLPKVLGKVFYKGGSKRPIPVTLEGKRQSFDEQGNKRRKLSEGGTKVVKANARPADVAHELTRALSCALVYLAPSTTTAVRVGKASMEPQHIQENVEAVCSTLVSKYVPQKWNNVRAIHMKGPNTAALPVWLTQELWEDEKDVLEEAPTIVHGKKNKKQKADALADGAEQDENGLEVIEVPGPDGKMRRLEKTSTKRNAENEDGGKLSKRQKRELEDAAELKAAERAEKAARKEALQKQKVAAKSAVNGDGEPLRVKKAVSGADKSVRKPRTKASDLI